MMSLATFYLDILVYLGHASWLVSLPLFSLFFCKTALRDFRDLSGLTLLEKY